MGREATGRATFTFAGGDEGASHEGKILLETDDILFRGGPTATLKRVSVKLADITALDAKDGVLTITTAQGIATYTLGEEAARWAAKIRSPPSVADKLGIKPSTQVATRGDLDPVLLADVRAVTPSVGAGVATEKKADVVLLAAETKGALAHIAKVRAHLRDASAIWVVYPKGRKEITEGDVLGAGRAAGLKDVKVARVSATHTGLRFVIPLDARTGK